MEKFLKIVTLALLTIAVSSQSDCSPSFTLPNILKDLVSLQYFDGSQMTYSYLFFSGMFSGPPLIAYSISQLSIEQPSSAVGYYLNVQIQDMYIYFYYNSPGYRWGSTSINFWITSRSDIIVTKNVMSKPASAKASTLSFALTSTLAGIDAQSTHVMFIVGLYCNFTQNLTVSVTPGTLSASSASLILTVGASVTVTNITILSVIYNPNVGQFLSNNGVLNYKSLSSQYFNLFNNFMPIYYVLAGISSVTLTSFKSFAFHLQVINSTVLSSTSNSLFDQIGISYLTIGAPTESVCAPCNNYVYSGNCVDSCPAETYAFTFSSEGKACLICDAIVGQIMNSLSNGCNCLPGYTLISANQCINSSQTKSTCNGTNVIQNGTSCICSPGTYNISGACGTCPSGQTYQAGVCASLTPSCQTGQYYDSTNSVCQCITMNSVINSQGACECMAGFYSINGFCITCDKGTVYNGFTCVTANCADNQMLVNGSCVCDTSSIAVGSLCVKCGSATFANKATNLCDSCSSNCLVCQSKTSCSQCTSGFQLDPVLLSCAAPSSKLVTVRTGFPIYTMQALLTDFLINSTSISSKSPSDLSKMISMQFNDTTAIPPRSFFAQNPSQLNQIRVLFYYSGLLPLSPFQVQFAFSDSTISLQQTSTVAYKYTTQKLQYQVS